MGRAVQGHRLAYAIHHGLDVFSMGGTILHSCDNTHCVNPDHLSMGTQNDNMADKVAKGRQAVGNSHGMSVLTDAQVQEIKMSYIKRHKEFGGRALSVKYGVHESTISDIMCGYTRRAA